MEFDPLEMTKSQREQFIDEWIDIQDWDIYSGKFTYLLDPFYNHQTGELFM